MKFSTQDQTNVVRSVVQHGDDKTKVRVTLFMCFICSL